MEGTKRGITVLVIRGSYEEKRGKTNIVLVPIKRSPSKKKQQLPARNQSEFVMINVQLSYICLKHMHNLGTVEKNVLVQSSVFKRND